MSETDPSPSSSLLAAPLAPFEGRRPPAPGWFEQALTRAPERQRHAVDGAEIETLAWGDPARPGLLLLHGNTAHADWWSFVAPFLADDFRVVAPSWSGMGGSSWRESYTLDGFVAELDGVAEAAGLFQGGRRPVVVAHSFGGFVASRYAATRGERLAGVIPLDMPLRKRRPEDGRPSGRHPNSTRPNRVYETEASALARFRFSPPQPCDNLFIADHMARASLMRAPLEGAPPDADPGWTWRFDPGLWREMRIGNPWPDVQASRCPVAVMWGGASTLVQHDLLQKLRGDLPSGTPFVEIPDAHHHVMVDQPLALVAALRGLLSVWPHRPA